MNADDDSWLRLIQGLRSGDPQSVQELWDQYGDLLRRFADKHLAKGVRRRVGPETVVQSAFWSFVKRAKGGEFQVAESKDLWGLLCAISLAKVREKTRFHLRQKRGLDREVHAPLGGEESAADFHLADPEPTPAEAAEFADQLQQLLDTLDDEEKQLVDLKLQDYTNQEIADRLGWSERTVRRVFKQVRARLARLFGEPS